MARAKGMETAIFVRNTFLKLLPISLKFPLQSSCRTILQVSYCVHAFVYNITLINFTINTGSQNICSGYAIQGYPEQLFLLKEDSLFHLQCNVYHNLELVNSVLTLSVVACKLLTSSSCRWIKHENEGCVLYIIIACSIRGLYIKYIPNSIHKALCYINPAVHQRKPTQS